MNTVKAQFNIVLVSLGFFPLIPSFALAAERTPTPAPTQAEPGEFLGQMLSSNASKHFTLKKGEPQVNPKNPNDWCWGIHDRVAHLKKIQGILTDAKSKLQPGTTLRWKIAASENGKDFVTRGFENWIVKEVSAAKDIAMVEVESFNAMQESQGTRTEQKAMKVFGVDEFDANNLLSCADNYMYSQTFGTEKFTLNKRQETGLFRQQATLGGAAIRQNYSASVPFGVAEETRIVENKSATKLEKNIEKRLIESVGMVDSVKR